MESATNVIENSGVIPRVIDVRNRIVQANKTPHRMGMMFGFLVAGRASEIVGSACKSDVNTTPRGPTGNDIEVAEARVKDVDYEVVVFNVKTSKRGGIPRAIGLPLDEKKEPWARPLLDYFYKFSANEHVFPYTRQALFPSAVEVFRDDFVYPIEEYSTQELDKEKFNELLSQVPEGLKHLVKPPKYLIDETTVKRHNRKLRLHGALRHYRLMELTSKFGFNRDDRKIFAGHTIDVTDRYIHLDWRSYFSKLVT